MRFERKFFRRRSKLKLFFNKAASGWAVRDVTLRITLGAFLQSNSMKTWSRENFLWNPCSQPRFSKLATKPANQSRLLNGTFCVFCDYLNVLPLKFYVKVCSKQFAGTKWDQLTILRVSKISFRVVQSTTVLRMYSHLPEGRKGFKCLAKSDWILFLSSWHVCEWVLGGKFFFSILFSFARIVVDFCVLWESNEKGKEDSQSHAIDDCVWKDWKDEIYLF